MADLSELILSYVERPNYRPLKVKGLARKLGISKRRWNAFLNELDRLDAIGKLQCDRNGRVRRRSAAGAFLATIKRTARGFGFATPVEPRPSGIVGDVAIDVDGMRDAQTGDRALVQLTQKRRSGGQRCGRILEVVERGQTGFVGTFFERAGQGFVAIEGGKFRDPLSIRDQGAKRVRSGDQVAVEIVVYPSAHRDGEAAITSVLGRSGEPGVDTKKVIHEFSLPESFPEDVLDDARRVAARVAEEDSRADRRDLTELTMLTIDPTDARDFDDAISLEVADDGSCRLGVHIADVSHLVRPGTPLDREARRRATSVYLPDYVIPMLPELLSNGLASLQQGEERLAKTVFIDFDANGRITHTEFARSLIRVDRRFTYEAVQTILRAPSDASIDGDVREWRPRIEQMADLASRLRARRSRRGMLELVLPEVRLLFDGDGKVTGARFDDHDQSHQIIEEFMIAANVAVAEKLSDLGVAFMRRVHPDPDFRKLRDFGEFVRCLGFDVSNPQSRDELQRVLSQARGSSHEHAVHFALLRSLKPASYSMQPESHFALATSQYCHFTSPIRRYPDLTVHRLIDDLCCGRPIRQEPTKELEREADQCTRMERRAEQAERELIRMKLLAHAAERLGEEIAATVSGVEPFGLFCQGLDVPFDGLLHVDRLPHANGYLFDPTGRCLVGRSGDHVFRLGQEVRVRLARVDTSRRQLDFEFVSTKRLAAAGEQQRRRPKKGRERRGRRRT